ncbi:putative aldouronate transport system substrate-binding protein [Neobacillus niacini]|uniref:extracellular solute-binding protein n=1 Tax=Neobacillus niacini TaxID=86668 RepID=UPI00285C094E|nr:extracellular solute-binding protein [Neobacillus niacini]MDR7078464.1 putative aldouronate transport system substrate-binding protein [Neobacillus niacini]
MKQRKRKNMFLAFILAIITAVVIAGCSSSEAGKEEKKEVDKKEVTDEKVAFSMAIRTLAIPHVENSPNINEDPYVKKIEEFTNTDIDIQLLPHNDYKTKMDLMFASGDIPDVVQGMGKFTNSGQSLVQAVEAGVFLPLDELIDEYGPNLKKFIPKEVWETQRFTDGKIYAIPQILSNPSRRATFVRKDLLEKAGLEVPKTVEETLEVLRAFKEMGVEQPFVARKGLSYSDTFFGAYDVQPLMELNKDGDPVPKYLDSANMKKAIQTYKTMYDEGLIHKEFLTQESNQYKDIIQSGKGGMFSANANVLNSWNKVLQASVPDAELAIIPSPVGTEGTNGGYVIYDPAFRNYFINAETKNPERIIQFLDWMVTEEATEFFTFGIEGEDYTKENGKINYKQAEAPDEVNKEAFRTGWLWLTGDAAYTEGLLETTPEGQQLLDTYENVLAKEGNGGITFEPPLTTFTGKPDMEDKNADGHSEYLHGHIVKMITGAEAVSDWDKVLEEWKKLGGDQYLKDAKAQYKEGKYYETTRK